MQIHGTTAIVTGAASGLGAATAAELARAGAQVVGLDLVDGSGELPEGVRLVRADITDEDEVRSALASISAEHPPLRIAVNCAGIAPARRVLSAKGPHDLALFRRAVEVNLVGTFNVLRLAAERIAATEPDHAGHRGAIVNTASIAAYDGQVGQIAYAASKSGVVGLTLSAARDLARHGIRVMTIAPGLVDTPLLAGLGADVNSSLAQSVPFPQRLARPEEFAALVRTVLEHDYLNGETVRMDGALRMAPH